MNICAKKIDQLAIGHWLNNVLHYMCMNALLAVVSCSNICI